MIIPFLDILILLGALQGFIVSGLLYFNKEKKQSDRFLAVLIFLLSLACLNVYLLDSNVGTSGVIGIIAFLVPTVIIMPVGPLCYFYVRSLTDSNLIFQKKDRAHFYPVIIDLMPSIMGLTYVIGAIAGLIDVKSQGDAWGWAIDLYNVYADIPRWISVTTYLWISYRHTMNLKSDIPPWPRQFIRVFALFQVLWLLYLIPYIIPDITWKLLKNVNWYPIYIPLAGLIYWLSIRGFLFKKIEESKKAKTSTLDSETVENTIKTLTTIMEKDRLFLNPGLSLNDVVKHTGIPQKIISSVINQHLNKSFNEFVNGWRVEEVKKRLLQTGNDHLTITGIALECGFNSQPTFQRTFKQVTGQTPREFQISHGKKEVNSSQI